jgi:hypothetical protein
MARRDYGGGILTRLHMGYQMLLFWSWSWSQSVDQFVWVLGLPLGPLTRFYLVLFFFFRLTITLFFFLTRKRVCSLQFNHSLVNNHTLPSLLRLLLFSVRVRVRVRVTLQLIVSQSVSMSWCRAQSGTFDQRFFFFFFFFFF